MSRRVQESPDAPGGHAGFLCSTEGLPVSQRAAYWRDMIDRCFRGVAIDWLSDQPIRARLDGVGLGDARVTCIINTPVRVGFAPPPDARGGYELVLQLAGVGRYTHAHREVMQWPGDLVLLDTAQAFEGLFPLGLRVAVWDLPRGALGPLLAEPQSAVASRVAGDHGLGALLAGYANALAGEARACASDEVTRRTLCAQLCNLTALTLGASQPARESRHLTYRKVRQQQILRYIEVHFRDAGLSAEGAALDLRMSRRWLNALLDDGGGFCGHVARRRVEECHRLLDDAQHDAESISQIAFGCGFDELSTFHRQFRARYGLSPREVRRARTG